MIGTNIDVFTLSLTMLSDWHIGTGSGIPGGIDRLICRDRHGFPFIPAKTLTGILRDSCELAAKALDDQEKSGPWQELVIDLFGSQPTIGQGRGEPVPAKLFIRPAFLEQTLQDYILSTTAATRHFLHDALSLTKAGIAINPKTGVAKDDHLRFYEMAIKGLVLEARCQINHCGFNTEAVFGLLAAGARLMNKIGGNRRRGAGKCKVSIIDHNMDSEIQKLFDINTPRNPIPSDRSVDRIEPNHLGPKGSYDWHKYDIDLETILPVSIHSQTLGNVGKSLDYIPGTNFLPHFAEKLSQLNIDVGDAINHDHFRILPFYPAIRNKRSLPVPFCISVKKEGGDIGVPASVNNHLCPVENNLKQEKAFKTGYIEDQGPETILPTYLNTPIHLYTHNTVDDESQRPGKSDQQAGGVYSYEAIAAGTKLKGMLWLSDELDMAVNDLKVFNSKGTPIHIGRSSKDDYGLCRYKISPIEDDNQPSKETEITEFTLTCLSDIILSQQGAATHDLQKHLLSIINAELEKKITLSPRPDNIEKPHQISSIIRSKRIESWHRKWQRPRPSMMCIAAGSVIAVTVTSGSLKYSDLVELMAKGIGERRTEGFGHIAINLPITTGDISRWAAPASRTEEKSESRSSQNQSRSRQHVTEKAFDRYIALACKLSVNNKDKRSAIFNISSETKPGKSQLGAMRGIFQKFYLSGGDKEAVSSWISNIKDTENRVQKWPEQSLEDIEALVTEIDKIWTILNEHSGLSTNIKDELNQAISTENSKIYHKKWTLAVTTLFNELLLAHDRYFAQGGK